MYNLSKGQIGWLAGIIDGEGSISIHRMNEKETIGGIRHRLDLSIVNTNKDMILLIQSWFGGSFWIKNKKDTNPNHKTCYRWRIEGLRSVPIIKMVYPYLVIKKSQATIALEFSKTLRSIFSDTRNPITNDVLDKRQNLHVQIKSINQMSRG